MGRTPPGPRSLVPFRFLRPLQRHPIPFLTRITSEYGDVVGFSIGPQKVIVLNHPDLIREPLVTQARSFHKSRVLQRARVVFGNGLLTSEGEFHKRQRRLVQPGFHRDRIAGYATVMVEKADTMRRRWRDGETVDMHREMMRLTLAVVAQTLFGTEVEGEQDEIGGALSELVSLFPLLMNPLAPLLQKLPLASSRRLRAAIDFLDRIIYSMIDEWRSAGTDRGDLLSMLLMAEDAEGDGGRMSNQQVRDEAITIFLAGHETTANALSWTFHLLGKNPEIEREMHGVIRETIGERLPTAADYPRLQLVEMIFAEAMRLYPPAWAVTRLAMEDVEIGGWHVPRGTAVVTSQALMHRDPRFWPDPERFSPLRFTPEAKAARPKFAYFPFGAGPRVCIGEGFAWMEGVLLLTTIAQKWRVENVSQDVEPVASITLRPRGGIQMRVRSV